MKAPPAAFELQKTGIVHHLVQLSRQLGVDRGNRLIDRARQVAVEGDRASQRLLDQGLDELLSAIGFGLLRCRDDLLEQATGQDGFRGGRGSRGLCVEVGNGSALLLAEPEFAG